MRQTFLAQLRADPIDWRYKGFAPSATPVTPQTVRAQNWNLLRGDLFLPTLILKESALAHNIALMRRWCDEHDVALAPHGKTTMSPELFARQIAAGAWAMTAATPSQMRAYRAFGVERILLANELVEPSSLRWLADELAADPGFEAYCLVDSRAGVSAMEAALAGHPLPRPLPVFVELGLAGGRTGARSVETALDVAAAVTRSAALRLAGAECYEGVLEDRDRVDQVLAALRRLVEALAARGAVSTTVPFVVTAGGSEYFDRVAEHLAGRFDGLPVKVVLRSGCYLSHDHGEYDRGSPLGARRAGGGDHFEPALECWGAILSRPEPDLALTAMGRRDVPFDAGLPVPLRVHTAAGFRDVRGLLRVEKLNDQHGFIRLPPDDPLAVGDLIGCGISHPCTAFDKWRLIPVVDDEYTIVDAVHTFF